VSDYRNCSRTSSASRIRPAAALTTFLFSLTNLTATGQQLDFAPCPVSPTIRLPQPADWEASPSTYILLLLRAMPPVHNFTDSKTMVRKPRRLGRRGGYRPCFRASLPPILMHCSLFLNGCPLFRQLLSVTPKVKNTLLLNIPVVRPSPFLAFNSLSDRIPCHSSAATTRTRFLPRTSRFNLRLP